jgi:hypothetical protein
MFGSEDLASPRFSRMAETAPTRPSPSPPHSTLTARLGRGFQAAKRKYFNAGFPAPGAQWQRSILGTASVSMVRLLLPVCCDYLIWKEKTRDLLGVAQSEG